MNNALFNCPTTGKIVRLEYTNGVLDLMVPYNADKSTLTAQGLSEAEAEEKLADFERSVEATWNWCDGVARQREFSSLEEAKEYLGSLGVTDIDFSDDQIFPDFPQIIICGDLMLQVSDLSQLISASMVLEATKKISMQVLSVPPRGEEYKGFLLLPTICAYGWRCDFSFPDGTLRKGGVSHHFPSQALTWGKGMVDTEQVYLSQVGSRQFADEPLVTRPFLMLAESIFGSVLANGDKSHWLLANYLLLHFGDKGKVDFWDDFLAPTVHLGPRQLTKRLKDLVRLGIIRYRRWSNRNCPTSYYLGPAWLSVEGVTLTSDDLSAIESGEMHDVENGYFWGIPLNDRGSRAETILRQEGDALVRIPNEPNEPIWYSTWKQGEWTHRRKASVEAELEPPLKKRLSWADLKAVTVSHAGEEELYKGYILQPRPCCKGGSLCWNCDVKLPDGKWLYGDEDYSCIEDALAWAKKMVNLTEDGWREQANGQQSNDALVYLLQHLDLMLNQYLPKSTDAHKLLLKYLILKFENKGTAKFWEYFLAPTLALSRQQLLRHCRELVKVGLLRYYRHNRAYMMKFYLGPAWLNAEAVTLRVEELEQIARGETAASYRPWWTGTERYPGEKYGWPCSNDSKQTFWQPSGTRTGGWAFSHQGNALVRVPTKPNYPTWYSTWQDSAWTHKSVINGKNSL